MGPHTDLQQNPKFMIFPSITRTFPPGRRLVDIILRVFIVISTVYFTILICEANSLLKTAGIFGIIAAFLSLHQ
jgi:hypothetical protein